MKPKAIIFDLDGTLCELGDSANPYNHDGEEIAIQSMEHIYRLLRYHEDTITIFLTGRKRNDYESVTRGWLCDNALYFDELIMQEGSTAEKNHIYKEKELVKLQEKYNIVAMFDDNPDLIPVCKRLGILLLQVHNP